MSKPVMRKGQDRSSAHADPGYEVAPGAWWEGSKADTGSPNVFVNGTPIMRINDKYKAHVGTYHVQKYADDGTPYIEELPNQHSPPKASEGSTTVFANGIGIHLAGHDVTCPQEDSSNTSKAVGGSPNVFAGE